MILHSHPREMLWCPRWTTTLCRPNDISKPLTFVCTAVQAVAVRALRTLQSLICNGGSGVRRAAFDSGMLQGVTSVLLPSIAATAVQRRANSLALAILLVGRTERYLLGLSKPQLHLIVLLVALHIGSQVSR